MDRQRIIIMGAAGRDFHNFNTYFKDNSAFEVIAFTATQIPNIEDRVYPAELSGELYPDGIPIHDEAEMSAIIRAHQVQQVIFAYSDVSHEYVMHKASEVIAAGADFRLMGTRSTQIEASKPIVSVCAARTGSGKSQTTRHVADILKSLGYQVAAIRHPMPYGDLRLQGVQRFETLADLDRHQCTIEEREEYEPHLERGVLVFAGVDYQEILVEAEREADVILWDGGNNDLPFYKPDLHIVLVDPLRPGHERRYHPGEANVITADVIVINKIDTASNADILTVRANVTELNPDAIIVEAASPVTVDDPAVLRGKRVLVVEDGPTLTHGEMAYGAGWLAAQRAGAAEIIDPRPFATGSILDTYAKYKNTGAVLPAMGYGAEQIKELETTINRAQADLVVIGTPIDLSHLLEINSPSVRVRYELQVIGKPTLREVIEERFGNKD
jgi:predicted GTPase